MKISAVVDDATLILDKDEEGYSVDQENNYFQPSGAELSCTDLQDILCSYMDIRLALLSWIASTPRP